jgi:hypothetical protein
MNSPRKGHRRPPGSSPRSACTLWGVPLVENNCLLTAELGLGALELRRRRSSHHASLRKRIFSWNNTSFQPHLDLAPWNSVATLPADVDVAMAFAMSTTVNTGGCPA